MYAKYFKRLFDFVGALLLMPFVCIFVLIVGIFIKLEDGGPIFYCGKRLGKGGKLFPMFKFRSMKVNSPDIRMPDGCTYNAKDDPRVTKVGHILRETSIDELPQAINILIGDMSFIGPRPDTPEDLETYSQEDMQILSVRPGVTGWNQVANRNAGGAREKLDNDIFYVKHLTFAFDMKIILRTIKNVLCRKNIYRA